MQEAPNAIVVRDVHFELDADDSDIPSDWHGDGLAVSRYFDTLSLLFPAAERFFVAAVKAFEPNVRDPALRAQLRLFCAQEGAHSHEHVAYNRMLERFGYAGSRLERNANTELHFLSRTLSPRLRLAITCALEHFTAVLAHLLLSYPEVLRRAHPKLAAVWRWHAAEENEHKAVAFDLYRQIGGSYFTRAWVMFATTLVFAYKITRNYFSLVPGQSLLRSARQFVAAQRYFVSQLPQRELLRLYMNYYRPSFHPWDVDNRTLLAAWRDEFETWS